MLKKLMLYVNAYYKKDKKTPVEEYACKQVLSYMKQCNLYFSNDLEGKDMIFEQLLKNICYGIEGGGWTPLVKTHVGRNIKDWAERELIYVRPPYRGFTKYLNNDEIIELGKDIYETKGDMEKFYLFINAFDETIKSEKIIKVCCQVIARILKYELKSKNEYRAYLNLLKDINDLKINIETDSRKRQINYGGFYSRNFKEVYLKNTRYSDIFLADQDFFISYVNVEEADSPERKKDAIEKAWNLKINRLTKCYGSFDGESYLSHFQDSLNNIDYLKEISANSKENKVSLYYGLNFCARKVFNLYYKKYVMNLSEGDVNEKHNEKIDFLTKNLRHIVENIYPKFNRDELYPKVWWNKELSFLETCKQFIEDIDKGNYKYKNNLNKYIDDLLSRLRSIYIDCIVPDSDFYRDKYHKEVFLDPRAITRLQSVLLPFFSKTNESTQAEIKAIDHEIVLENINALCRKRSIDVRDFLSLISEYNLSVSSVYDIFSNVVKNNLLKDYDNITVNNSFEFRKFEDFQSCISQIDASLIKEVPRHGNLTKIIHIIDFFKNDLKVFENKSFILKKTCEGEFLSIFQGFIEKYKTISNEILIQKIKKYWDIKEIESEIKFKFIENKPGLDFILDKLSYLPEESYAQFISSLPQEITQEHIEEGYKKIENIILETVAVSQMKCN